MNILETYNAAEKALFDHVGFKPNWVTAPIVDCSEYFWQCNADTVKYGMTQEVMESDGDYYLDDIYKQRFYDKHVYEGSQFTMIFCNPHVDGMKWLRIFDNNKRINNF